MNNIAAADDIPFLLGLLAFAAVFTFAISFSLGRLVVRRSRIATVLLCGLFVPLVFVAGACVVRYAIPDQPPPNEAKGYVFVGLLTMGALATPISLLASYVATLWLAKRLR
jgi:hypothetical protein